MRFLVYVALSALSATSALQAQTTPEGVNPVLNENERLATAGAVALPPEIDLKTFLSVIDAEQGPLDLASAPATIRFGNFYDSTFSKLRLQQADRKVEQAAIIYRLQIGDDSSYRVISAPSDMTLKSTRDSVSSAPLLRLIRAQDGNPIISIHTHPGETYFSDADIFKSIISRRPELLLTPSNAYITWPSPSLRFRQSDKLATRAAAAIVMERARCDNLSASAQVQLVIDLFSSVRSITYKREGDVFKKVMPTKSLNVYDIISGKQIDSATAVGMLLARDGVDGLLRGFQSGQAATELNRATNDRKALLASLLHLGAIVDPGWTSLYLGQTDGKLDRSRPAVFIATERTTSGCNPNRAIVDFYADADIDNATPTYRFLVTKSVNGFAISIK